MPEMQVNTIPPWVHTRDEEGDTLLPSPSPAIPHTRHYRPPPPKHYKAGRKWDHLRTEEPALLSQPIAESQTRWKSFMQSGPQPESRGGRVVSPAWMEQNMPYLNADLPPTDAMREPVHKSAAKGITYKGKWLISPERQERTVRLFWRLLLKNPFIPLIFRAVIFIFTAAALGMSASIYVNIQRVRDLTQTEPSHGHIDSHRPEMPTLEFRRFANTFIPGQCRPRSVQPVRQARIHLHGPRCWLNSAPIHRLRHLGRVHEQTARLAKCSSQDLASSMRSLLHCFRLIKLISRPRKSDHSSMSLVNVSEID